jgi:AcrR family transcriptional regulator
MPTARIEGLTTERFANILSVALDEFASCRYNDASFNRIIKNCGMAKGTMYYYFKSKEDLFLTIHKATLRDFRKVTALASQPVDSPHSFWMLAEELLLEFYRTLYRKPVVSQFVTNFLTQESRREGHPAISTVASIDAWLKTFLLRGQELDAIRQDLELDQITILAWGIWEGIRSWLPSEENQMQALVHPDVILDIFRRTMTPIDSAPQLQSDAVPSEDIDDSPFMGASAEAMGFDSEN